MRQKTSDMWIGLGLLLFSAFAVWRTMKIKVPPEATIAGTSFVPWLMIGGIVLLSFGLIFRAVLSSVADKTIEVPDPATLVKMGFFTLVMIVYAAGFMTFGYIPSTIAVFIIGLLLFRERRLVILIIFPLIMTGLIYLGFTRILNVWLP